LPRCQGKFERDVRARGFRHVAGVDEVGRGCIFGPVVAAAVILSPERPIRGLRDSKMLPPEDREALTAIIKQRAICWAVGAADTYEIDRINIYQASRVAMKRAVEKLTPLPDFLLVDAIKVDLPIEQEAMIQGDGRSQCIAAASIVAKTHRDEMMRKWDEVFPFLGLVRHKGYGTEEHLDAIRQHGPTLLHRFSFEPVRAACQYELWTGYDQIEVAEEAHA
jgi:ribonuclease HII